MALEHVHVRLIRCFQTVFSDIRESELPEASVANTVAWDSINALTLVQVIEEEFGIELDLDELEHLTSFGAIERYLTAL